MPEHTCCFIPSSLFNSPENRRVRGGKGRGGQEKGRKGRGRTQSEESNAMSLSPLAIPK